MANICIRSIINGKVQGVWFRASTCDQAKQLGLTGWVRNCRDGTVEVMACGQELKVRELQRWLRDGPPNAMVAFVNEETVEWQDFSSFDQR